MPNHNDSWIRRFAFSLSRYAAASSTDAPVYDGSSASLKARGMAYLLQKRQRAPVAPWFVGTATFQGALALGAEPDLTTNVVFLAVRWPSLLAHALLAHANRVPAPPPLQKLSHELWWALEPLVEQFDSVLAAQLRRSRERVLSQPARAAAEPYWLGLETQAERVRFDAQVSHLMTTRRTAVQQNKGFLDYAVESLRDTFEFATNTLAQRSFGLCSNVHRRGGTCEACPSAVVDRPVVSVLDHTFLGRHLTKVLTLKLTQPVRPEIASTVIGHNLRWILDAHAHMDGVHRFTGTNGRPLRMLNFAVLRGRWAEFGVASIFDTVPIGVTDSAHRAKRMFRETMAQAYAPLGLFSFDQEFAKSEWADLEGSACDPDICEVYDDGVLATRLAKVDSVAAALVLARRARPVPVAPSGIIRRVVMRTYKPTLEGHKETVIGVIRKKTIGGRIENFFTTPYIVEGEALEPKWRRGRGIKYEGHYYWTLQTLNHFANLRTQADEPYHVDARSFLDWAELLNGELIDRQSFTKALYDDGYTGRITAIEQGTQAHLGAFTKHEDGVIADFFFKCPQRHRLTDEVWDELLRLVPHRSKRGILKRLDDMGKEYARKNGYKAYSTSQFCRKFSAARRRQWAKEGIV